MHIIYWAAELHLLHTAHATSRFVYSTIVYNLDNNFPSFIFIYTRKIHCYIFYILPLSLFTHYFPQTTFFSNKDTFFLIESWKIKPLDYVIVFQFIEKEPRSIKNWWKVIREVCYVKDVSCTGYIVIDSNLLVYGGLELCNWYSWKGFKLGSESYLMFTCLRT